MILSLKNQSNNHVTKTTTQSFDSYPKEFGARESSSGFFLNSASFLVPGENIKLEIKSLPGIFRFSEDLLMEEIGACMAVGVQTFLIFPAIPEELKDKGATYSYSKDNFYLKAARNIKKKFPSSCIISDVAMDPYSIDGHDGWVEDGQILNDKTLPVLAKMAVAQAEAGFDMIGPSDMMDGRIQYIREYLDNEGYTNTGIMAYTAKYASTFYGPFRDALDSAPKTGDKKTYQMNPANLQEALKRLTWIFRKVLTS